MDPALAALPGVLAWDLVWLAACAVLGAFALRASGSALRLAAGAGLLVGGLVALFVAQRAGAVAGASFEAGTTLGLAAACGSVMLFTYAWRNPEGMRSPVAALACFVMIFLVVNVAGIAHALWPSQRLYMVATLALAGLGSLAFVDTLRQVRGSPKAFPWALLTAAWIAVAIGLGVTLGWLSDGARIVQGMPGTVPMRPVVALCLVLSGLAFVATVRGRRTAASALLLPVVLVAALSLIEIVMGLDFGLERFLPARGVGAASPSGRMPAHSAAVFIAVAAALVATFRARGNELAWPLVWGLGFAITAVAGLVVLGYSWNVMPLQPWGNTSPMAFWTSLGFTALGVGIMAFGLGEADARGRRGVRTALLVAILSIGASAFVWITLSRHQEAARRASLEDAQDAVLFALEHFVRVRLMVFRDTSERLAAADAADLEKDFRVAARIHVRDFPGITSLALVDARNVSRYVQTRPGVASVEDTAFAVDAARLRALGRARESGEIVVEPVVRRVGGQAHALVLVAIPPHAEVAPDVLVAGIQLAPLLEATLRNTARGYAIEIHEGDRLLYARGAEPRGEGFAWRTGADRRVYGVLWRVSVWPTTPTLRQLGSRAPELALLLGLLGGLLFATALRFGAISRERARLSDARSAQLAAEVAERARAEAALDSARLELQGVLESITDAFYLLDTDWRFVYVNERAAAILRLPVADMLGRSIWEVFPEARQEPIYGEFQRAVDERRTASFESHYAPLDLWYENRAYPHAKGLSVYFRDVSEQKRAYQLLHRSEAMRARAQRIARLGNWELDVATGGFSLSPEVYEIFGRDPAEFEGTLEHFFTYAHPEDTAALRAAAERSMREGAPIDVEFRVVRPDGESRVMHVLGADVGKVEQGRTFSGTVQDVTERRAESRRLAHVQRIAHLGSWEVAIEHEHEDADLNPVFWSDETYRIFGFEPGEVAMDIPTFFARVHPDDRELIRAATRDLIAGVGEFNVDFRIVLRDGTLRHAHEEADVVRDPAGVPTRLVGTIQDVTARKRDELALRRSEERLSAILENTPWVAVQRYDLAGRVLYFNQASTMLSGYSSEEAMGRTLDQLTQSAEGARKFLGIIQQIERTGEVVGPFESNVMRRDGEARTVLSTVFRIPEPLGGHSFVCMDVDITDRKHAELELQQARLGLEEQRQRFRSLFDYHPDAVFAYDLDGRMIACNEAALALVGRPREQLIGMSLGQLLVASERAGAVERYERALHGEPQRFETSGTSPDGTLFMLDVTGLPIVVDGRIVGVFAIARDITELRRANLERDAALANLERSNRDLQDFAFVASHDLQEPLRKVQAFGGRLRDEFAALLGERGGDYLERMTGAAERMQRLIEALLRYSRVTSRGQPFQPVELERVATEVLSDLEISIEAAGATVELRDLPRIDADPTQMRQLFQNLLGNALKFGDATRPVRIIVSASETRRDSKVFCRIEFRDNGIGFEPQYAENIFMPFHRLHGRAQFEGSGIGLAIVRKIVERHGGSVHAESQPGAGSAFIVELPLTHAGLPARAGPATASDFGEARR